jgi:hypothetical protein
MLVAAAGLTLALLAGACTSARSGSGGGSGERSYPRTIPQPVMLVDLPVAPESERVDIAVPTFSNPTDVTNPLFPVSRQDSVLLVGHVEGKPFRTEVTLLPNTRIIEWRGQQVETLVSQYVAFLDGRIHEVAYDHYAQADDGSVWYFGEDVFNFRHGVIADTEGTWIAGQDGPPAMIMPGHPRVGDVYRPENIPGLVFEEVTVKSSGQVLNGPLGPIDGGLLVRELHDDGTYEDKTFAPGYGEFFTGGGGDVEALAMAVPTDAASGVLPPDLASMSDAAMGALDASLAGEWKTASARAADLTEAWKAFPSHQVPRRVGTWIEGAVEELDEALAAPDRTGAPAAAIQAARWLLDLHLRYRPQVEVDLARLDLWAAQIEVDAAAGDAAAVGGDFFVLDYVRDRILAGLDATELTRLNTVLAQLQSAVIDRDLAAAADQARHLRDTVAGISPMG